MYNKNMTMAKKIEWNDKYSIQKKAEMVGTPPTPKKINGTNSKIVDLNPAI